MQRLILALLAATVFAPSAFAQALPTLADCSISSLSGSSQQLVAKNTNRKSLRISNPSLNQNVYLNLSGGTAASAVSSLVISPVASGVNSLTLTAGDTGSMGNNTVTVTGTPGSPVTCYEGR